MRSGFSVVQTEDGAVAFGRLRDHRYGPVLLDIRMPKLDGWRSSSPWRSCPVVVHSAFSVSVEERQRLGVKVVRYLHKPVSPQQLLSAVQNVLGTGSGP